MKLYFTYTFSWKSRAALFEYKKQYENVNKLSSRRAIKLNNQLSDQFAEKHVIIGRNLRNLNLTDEALNSFLYGQNGLISKSPFSH